MTHAFDFSVPRVIGFMRRMLPGLKTSEDMTALGLLRDGELTAGVLYEGFNGKNLWMHVAAAPGKRWMVREYLLAAFAYPFWLCGVERISGYVDASNAAARRFNTHLGFTEEARLRQAAADGGDVILYVLWKRDCRFLEAIRFEPSLAEG